MNYNEAVSYLYDIPSHQPYSDVENLKLILYALDQPQNKFRYIHVAGTNGKGSVCAYTDSCLRALGKTTGMFSSPHLVRVNERIKINSLDITDDELAALFTDIKKAVDHHLLAGGKHPSFFEFVFLMAVVWFARNKVDYGIIEAGIGGSRDITNLIEKPELSVITAIDLDHQKILGQTLQEIAVDKAGIIKTGCPVVYLNDQENAAAVIKEKAVALTEEVYALSPVQIKIQHIGAKGIDFYLNYRYDVRYEFKLSTYALYQTVNASLAACAVSLLLEKGRIENVDRENFNQIVESAIEQTVWPGRMEQAAERVFVDGAHNLAGIQSFRQNLETFFSDTPVYILFGAGEDKAYPQMIEVLCGLKNLKGVIITDTGVRKTADVENIISIFEKNWNGIIDSTYNIKEALSKGRRWTGHTGYLFCIGSLYLVGRIKEILGGTAND